jgi:hypothetical protein
MFKQMAFLLLFAMSATVCAQSDVIITDSTTKSTSTVDSRNTSVSETTVKTPPNSAIAPSISVMNNDLCTTGVSGAVQTQILGISSGSTIRDLNCERLKLSKTLFDMGMKVAAVSALCQDARVFSAMMNAGTPCPIDGKIGEEAKRLWDANPSLKPKAEESQNAEWKKVLSGILTFIALFAIF